VVFGAQKWIDEVRIPQTAVTADAMPLDPGWISARLASRASKILRRPQATRLRDVFLLFYFFFF